MARVLITRGLITRVLMARVLLARVLIARVLIARVLIARVIAFVILAPSHQAKGYGEDDQNDSSAYKFHTLTSRWLNRVTSILDAFP